MNHRTRDTPNYLITAIQTLFFYYTYHRKILSLNDRTCDSIVSTDRAIQIDDGSVRSIKTSNIQQATKKAVDCEKMYHVKWIMKDIAYVSIMWIIIIIILKDIATSMEFPFHHHTHKYEVSDLRRWKLWFHTNN